MSKGAFPSVLILTPWFPNRPGDRDGNFIHDSAAALQRKGIATHVVVARRHALPRPGDRYRTLSPGFDGAAFTNLASVTLRRYFAIPRNKALRWTEGLQRARVMPALRDIAARTQPALIHAHTEAEAPLAVEAARMLRIPCIVTLHGINRAPSAAAPAYRAHIGAALGRTDRIVLVGEPLRGFFREVAGREDHFRVVPNGVALPVAEHPSLFQRERLRFISVANLHEGKGIDLTLAALGELQHKGRHDWSYTIVGDGPEREHLVAEAARLGLSRQVSFRGAVTNDTVWTLLRESDVFVLPSSPEAFGIAYLEAMASGLLAIGVRGEGPSAFIEDGVTGFLVEPRNVASLGVRLSECLASRERIRQIAAAGCAHVRQNFTWDAHAEKLLDVYREVAA